MKLGVADETKAFNRSKQRKQREDEQSEKLMTNAAVAESFDARIFSASSACFW